MLDHYSLSVSVAPTARPISAADLATELSIDSADDDKLEALIDEATRHLEWACGRALCTQTIQEAYDRLPQDNLARPLRLHRGPVQSVTSITYTDTAGSSQTWASTNYTADLASDPARIGLDPDGTLPTVETNDLAVFTVTYVAGYGGAADVPAPAKEFIYTYCRWRYERRPPDENERRHMLSCLAAMTVDF